MPPDVRCVPRQEGIFAGKGPAFHSRPPLPHHQQAERLKRDRERERRLQLRRTGQADQREEKIASVVLAAESLEFPDIILCDVPGGVVDCEGYAKEGIYLYGEGEEEGEVVEEGAGVVGGAGDVGEGVCEEVDVEEREGGEAEVGAEVEGGRRRNWCLGRDYGEGYRLLGPFGEGSGEVWRGDSFLIGGISACLFVWKSHCSLVERDT